MKNNIYAEEIENLLNQIEDACCESRENRRKLERLQEKENNPIIENLEEETYIELEDIEEDSFEEEISYYLEQYNNLEENFTEEDIKDTLPSKNNYHYEDINKRLQAESLKEIKEIEEIIVLDNNLTKEEYIEYKRLIELERNKIKLLKKQLIQKQDKNIIEEYHNKILFSKTPLLNDRITEELKRIPQEYYKEFYELIKSIENGTFKNVKRLSRNKDLYGVSEVRNNQSRVVFTRLNKDTYILITLFIKKCQSDRLYKKTLLKKVKEYKNNENLYISRLNDNEYIEENNTQLQELYKILNKKEKTLIKKV